MKTKSPTKTKRGGLQGDRKRPRTIGHQDKCGVHSYQDIWLIRLCEEVNRACDRFWTRTVERRRIEAKRQSAGFMQRAFAACKKF